MLKWVDGQCMPSMPKNDTKIIFRMIFHNFYNFCKRFTVATDPLQVMSRSSESSSFCHDRLLKSLCTHLLLYSLLKKHTVGNLISLLFYSWLHCKNVKSAMQSCKQKHYYWSRLCFVNLCKVGGFDQINKHVRKKVFLRFISKLASYFYLL